MSNARALWLAPSLLLAFAASAAAQPSADPEAPPSQKAPTAGRQSAPRGRELDPDTAVREAILRNPSYLVTELDIARARQSVIAEQGRYPYVFQADAGYTRSSSPRLANNGDVRSNESTSVTLGTALRRTFPFGTTAELRLQGERFESNISLNAMGPTSVGAGYGVTARASVVQPLLRGSGRTVGEIELRAARDNETIAEKARLRAASELARDVLMAYWELWYADESLRIERAALELARAQETQAEQQRASGALAAADVLTFSSRVAQLEEAVVSAELALEQRSLELSRLMGGSSDQASFLVATAAPTHGPLATRSAVQHAIITGSLELSELEAQARLARTRAEVAGEASRPRLDIDGSLETRGVGERVPSAAERAAGLNWVTASIGATFETPLDNSRREAEKQNALLQVRIAEFNIRALRDRLSAQAASTVADERAAEQRLLLSKRTLDVAEQAYAAARGRFELGGAIAIQVQQAEEDVRRARLRLARAKVDLAQAQVLIEHLLGALATRYTDSPRSRRNN